MSPSRQARAFGWVVLLLTLAAAASFAPLWAPLVVAVWTAVLAQPLLAKTARLTRGRHRAAGALVVLMVVALFVPLAASIVSLSRGAIALWQDVAKSDGAKSALIAVVSGDDKPGAVGVGALVESPQKLIALVQSYGEQAFRIVGGIFGAATEALLGFFIFVYAVYVFLVDGPAMYAWMEQHAPLEVTHTRRFVAAFNETGRGLLVGVGLTGLAQGVVATVTYFALGVPRALVLGLITCLASLIPSVGTALVWVPIAIGLALAGKTVAAVVMGVVGVFAIGAVDNVMRPIFSRFGRLELPSFVLLTSMFGGLALFGGWGLLLGPLFTRLAKEGLVMARIDRLHDKRAEIDAARALEEPEPGS